MSSSVVNAFVPGIQSSPVCTPTVEFFIVTFPNLIQVFELLIRKLQIKAIPATEITAVFIASCFKEEIGTIKKLVAESKHDTEMNLMLILEDKAPELYRRIEEKMLDCSREIWWHFAVSEGEVSYDDDLFQKNYLHDIETGDFKPSEDFVPEGDYDEEEYEDMEYIEWYEREQERMEYEDVQWFRERYNETFEDIDLSDEKYFCYIPEEFLPDT